MRYTEKTRFFKCALRTLIDLGGVMYKHELCLGPMSINDEDDNAYWQMITDINNIRGDKKRLNSAFAALCKSLGMKHSSVDNATRTPIGLMKNCGWIEAVWNKSLYGNKMKRFKITEYGRKVYTSINAMCDIRLPKFESYSSDVQAALIRLGTYSIFQRAGLDTLRVNDTISKDKELCSDILNGRALLFSPSATLRRKIVEDALGEHFGTGISMSAGTFLNKTQNNRKVSVVNNWELNISKSADFELLKESEDIEFLNKINELKHKGMKSSDIIVTLFEEYKTSKKEEFYSLISTLFKILGFNCSYSRPGDNGARWDAIIDDPQQSIPIEIKSPTEEEHISHPYAPRFLQGYHKTLRGDAAVLRTVSYFRMLHLFLPKDPYIALR
ncbi:MAG: hypothetical protein NC299_06505 [Lachnospiraceae bacterium]|nr:hypothetical protein [Lachnospiraceae bacterium]